jgi:hypothetical protein
MAGYLLEGLDELCVALAQHLERLVEVLSELAQGGADHVHVAVQHALQSARHVHQPAATMQQHHAECSTCAPACSNSNMATTSRHMKSPLLTFYASEMIMHQLKKTICAALCACKNNMLAMTANKRYVPLHSKMDEVHDGIKI